ncbi:MAG TPA: methyltransferase [Chloroflexota bacterium]
MTDGVVDLERLSDLQTPWCLRVAVTLRVAEHIAEGASSIEELAATTQCDREALHSVLTYLASRGVFEEPNPGRFELNEAAHKLLEPGMRLGLDLDGIGGRMSFAWGTLPSYVKTGMPAYHEFFGRPFWEDLDANPVVAASFDALMGPAGHGLPDPAVLLNDDWAEIQSVVDVGGGTGTLLAEILRARPTMRGTLVDLPRTVGRSADVFDAAGVADRVTALGQSFFEPLPAGADLYLLMKVLNDWPDQQAQEILRRCAEAARPSHGRVVICGGVSPEGAPRSLVIEMLLVGGRSRGLPEFRALAASAGLEVTASGRLRGGKFAVECRSIS